MEDDWEIYSKTQIDEINKLKLSDLMNLVSECHTMLKETKDTQAEIMTLLVEIKSDQQREREKEKVKVKEKLLDENEVITHKDSNYTNTVRETNRAWRLYGNHYKPILPLFNSGIYSGFNNDFLTNINNTITNNTINTDDNVNESDELD